MDATPLYIISIPSKEAGFMLDKLPLNGKKTYVLAALTVLYGISGLLIGELQTQEAMMIIAGGLGLTTLGHKIDKSTTN